MLTELGQNRIVIKAPGGGTGECFALAGNDGTGLGANQRVWFPLQAESVRDEDRTYLLFVISGNKFAGGQVAKHAAAPMPDEKNSAAAIRAMMNHVAISAEPQWQ
jgi:hypothetical protein